MITTIVTAAPNPVTPIAMRREAEASGRIQPKLMNRDSKVHRFIPPGERASGGVADATERRNALAQMKYRCGSSARCEAGCRNGHDYNIATRRKCASGAGARRFSLRRAAGLSVLNMFDHARSVLHPSNNSQILQMWFADFETEERSCESDLLAWC